MTPATAKGPTSQRPAVATLSLALVACAVVGGLSTFGLAGLASWSEDSARLTIAAALGAGVCLLPALLGTAMLVLFRTTEATRGMAILAVSVGRMLFSLLLALAAFLLLDPEGKTFWTAFLITSLLTIAADAAWSVRELARTSHAHPPIAHPATSATIGVS